MDSKPETLTFMPNGDLTLHLVRHVGDQSQLLVKKPPNESEDAPAEEAGEEEEAADESDLFYAPDPPETEHTVGVFYPPVRGRRDSGASSVRDRSASPPPGFWARLKKEPVVIIPEKQDVSCVVSSGHMMLASAYFQKRLSGEYYDAITLRNTGHLTISLDNDPDTFTILLNIIHGRTRQVPRRVSLELLSRLAVLVNFYGMLESVELFSDTWIENLKREGMPTEYDEQVLPWLFIFWVFEKGRDFRDMARLVQRECDERLDELVGIIPLPHTMINAMKNGRQIAIDSAITAIDQLITKYMDGKVNCKHTIDDDQRYACDAMVLGSLMKGARAIGIWPKPAAPFSGKRLGKLLVEIRSIKILDIYSNQRSGFNPPSPSWNCHGLVDSIKATMKIIEEGLDDLELDDYKKNSEQLWEDFATSPPTPAFEEAEEIPLDAVQDAEQESIKPTNVSAQTYSVPEDAIEDVFDELGSEDEIEKRFSDEIFNDDYPEEIRFGPVQKKSVIEETKENYPQRSSYVIPRKDVNSKSFEKESMMEEVKSRSTAEQTPLRKSIEPESPNPRPVLEEVKRSYATEQSPHQKTDKTESPNHRPIPEEAKGNYIVDHAPPYRSTTRPESPMSSPIIEEIQPPPYEQDEAAKYARGRSILSEVKASFPPEPVQVPSPHRKDATTESLWRRPDLENIRSGYSSDQSHKSPSRRENNTEPPKRSPMIEEVRGTHELNKPFRSSYQHDSTAESSRVRSPPVEVKQDRPSDQVPSPPYRKETNAEPPRRSPAIQEVKDFYPFEQGISDPPIEGVKVSENWRDSSILNVSKAPIEEVKVSPKAETQTTAGSISNEDNDLFIPPATFKVRKSKKRFATRF